MARARGLRSRERERLAIGLGLARRRAAAAVGVVTDGVGVDPPYGVECGVRRQCDAPTRRVGSARRCGRERPAEECMPRASGPCTTDGERIAPNSRASLRTRRSTSTVGIIVQSVIRLIRCNQELGARQNHPCP